MRLSFPDWTHITQLCRGEDLEDPVLSGLVKFPSGNLGLDLGQWATWARGLEERLECEVRVWGVYLWTVEVAGIEEFTED